MPPCFTHLTHRFGRPWVAVVLGLVIGSAAGPRLQAQTDPTDSERLAEAWSLSAQTRFKEAHLAFNELAGEQARYGQAVTLLMQQPKTAANLDRAASLLQTLAETAVEADLRLAALYQLGRIEHVHQAEPDLAAASRYYERVIAAAPGHHYAEMAAVKRAIIALHAPVDDAERRRRFERSRGEAESLVNPALRRDYLLMLADLALNCGYGEDVALGLMLDAERAGISRPTELASALVRIGELARATGDIEMAARYYRKFLKNYPRDIRRLMVGERLDTLEATRIAPTP